MTAVPAELRALIDAGPLTHLTTINADGSPHVNVIWIGRDGDQIISGHMSHKRIVRNIERDPPRRILGSANRRSLACHATLTTLRAHPAMSVRDMVEALVAGQRDPHRLAGLARGKMKAKRAALVRASLLFTVPVLSDAPECLRGG